MNTIANQRVLKARISQGWSHDSAQFSFYRVTPKAQQSVPFRSDARISAGEFALWVAVFAFVAAVLFLALGLSL